MASVASAVQARREYKHPDGADQYIKAMWQEAQEAGESVNWASLDSVYSEGGYRDEPGYSEQVERTLR